MTWVTVAWSMIASACLTVALIQLLVWLQQREQWVYLLFALTAVAAAATAAFELLMMRAETVAEFALAQRWIHLPIFALVVALVWFVRLHFGTGRVWLAWTVSGLRGLALILNFLSPQSLNYTAITGLRRVELLGGEVVSVAQGVVNPLIRIGELSSLLLLVFVVDASLTLWRRGAEGDRHRAVVIGGGVAFAVIVAAGHGALLHAGVVRSPYLISVAFLGIVLAISAELSANVVRVAKLARRLQASEAELRASEQRMRLAAEAAHLGTWVWNITQHRFWATDECHALLGFRPDETMTLASFFARLHPDDRAPVERAMRQSIEERGGYRAEYRVLLPGGALRWIAARGRVEDSAPGQGMRMLGACIDITERRLAEDAAHDLSGRLIHAQEAERMRVARELHDDLGQGLALLSIELDMLGQRPPSDPAEASARVQALSAHVKSLAWEVHRLSYELHPVTLGQLELSAALRGLCQELALAHGTAIDFEGREVPRALPQELTLCLYRIAQEALQNVVKHSGAARATVALKGAREALYLAVSDDGCGFDPQATLHKQSLGLVSMRERVRLLRGQLSIESRPGAGTRIEARVPLASQPALPSLAG